MLLTQLICLLLTVVGLLALLSRISEIWDKFETSGLALIDSVSSLEGPTVSDILDILYIDQYRARPPIRFLSWLQGENLQKNQTSLGLSPVQMFEYLKDFGYIWHSIFYL